MKKIITIFLLIVSTITFAQKQVTLVFDHGMTVVDGFVNDGVQISIPTQNYDFYMLGEKNIMGIERFDSFEQYKLVEKEFTDMYQSRLYGDTEVVVEIQNSPMFGGCTVIYSYYESAMYTNSIGNMWCSMADGDYTIVITTNDGMCYSTTHQYFLQKRFIRLKDGCLVEQRELPLYKD
jgi:hypothetical protein